MVRLERAHAPRPPTRGAGTAQGRARLGGHPLLCSWACQRRAVRSQAAQLAAARSRCDEFGVRFRCLAVVHGYVGNRCAVLALQLHGIEADCVNSVQLSNHTGYGHFKGQVLSGEDLDSLTGGLRTNGLLAAYTHVLTGYIGSESFLRRVVGVVDEIRDCHRAAGRPDVSWVCDPVLGDDGRCYVPESLVSVYRSEVVRRATTLTPNQFEAELLSGVSIRDLSGACEALAALHDMGCPTVVMTSSDLPEAGEGKMLLVASCPWEAVEGDSRLWPEGEFGLGDSACFAVRIPRLEGAFTGTGDLTSSLLLALGERQGRGKLASACLLAVRALQAVCRVTAEFAASPAGQARARAAEEVAASSGAPGAKAPPPELRLVQARKHITDPPQCDGVSWHAVVSGAVCPAVSFDGRD